MPLLRFSLISSAFGSIARRSMNTWNARRPNALGTKGAVSCDQPLAAHAALRVLEEGGTAADAAVTIATTLSVVQAPSCGLGGDCWILYYDAKSKRVHCINGHGRTPAAFTHETLDRLGFADYVPLHHPVTTAVPGAPGAFCFLHERFGNGQLSRDRLFEPAIRYARDGFPVGEACAYLWRCGLNSLDAKKPYRPGGAPAKFPLDPVFLTSDGQTPKAGQTFRMPDLARTLEEIARDGPRAFYQDGRIARAIVECQRKYGGLLTMEDLAAHKPDLVEPVKLRYHSEALNRDFDVYETPLNSQGIVTLESMKLLSEIDRMSNFEKDLDHYYHSLIESLKISFADLSGVWTRSKQGSPTAHDHLLSTSHARERLRLFDREKAAILSTSTFLDSADDRPADTTYFNVLDQYGNGCSVVYSTYAYFGTGYVPDGCGFTLSNRSYHVWEFQHKKFTPSVRPFSTLMSGLMTHGDGGELAGLFGCMGGPNQPQGHLQILLNLLEFGHTPQQSLNRPRVMIDFDFHDFSTRLNYEEGIPTSVIDSLRSKGHHVSKYGPLKYWDRNMMGRGQVITRGTWWDKDGKFHDDPDVMWAACDPRSDGCALVL